MTLFRFILRTLTYFRGVNLAVIAGVAVATGVLSGALMVGDSVRASLADLAVQRLGKIDHAMLSTRFFDASLAKRISDDPEIAGRFALAPAIITRGGALLDSPSGRTAGVQIIGTGDSWAPVQPGTAILNSQTAESLGLKSPGGDVVLSVPAESDVPRDATLAQRSRQETLSGLRARITSIVSEPGMLSLFTPAGGQRAPQNAWVSLTDLQSAVGRRGKINTLFVDERNSDPDASQRLNAALRRVVTANDYDLRTAPTADGTQVAITSANTYIAKPVEVVADRIAKESGIPLRKISINLINTVARLGEDGQSVSRLHYAVAAGITTLDDVVLADDQIALNEWAAGQLNAKVGDRLTLQFYRRQPDGSLDEVSGADRGFSGHFQVARILPMSGLGADPSLTPTYKGLTDASSIASWTPPAEVKIDKSLVTQADEDYWKAHKAAPKLFVNFATAERLWGAGFGDATGLRVPANRADEFVKKLVAGVDPIVMGLVFRPLRQEQIAAASGPTDFGQLFIAFSFFLIVAAVLLVAMLLRLGIEQRARQLGAMSAIGFSPAALRRMALFEGMILSICGGIIGSLGAVGYSWLMIVGLRTWWIGAIGTSAMRLHVSVQTLVIGFIISQIVALVAILWAVRQVGRTAPSRLLAGGWETRDRINRGRSSIVPTVGSIGLAIGLAAIVCGTMGLIPPQTAFLIGGATLLAAGLCLLSGLLHPRRHEAPTTRTLMQLAVRNATRHPARSVLCVGLIALAAFALVTVAAMRQGEPTDTGDPRSGSGGYRLIVEADIPLHGNPSTVSGRELLGFREPATDVWNRVEFVPMRRRAGDDISCLNITHAANPTITAVPDALIRKGGFSFASVPSNAAKPWELLEQTDPDGTIPVFTDDNTATYILHIKVGDTIEITDDAGAAQRLKLVATLSGSIFQGELLMGDAHFRSLFPTRSGFEVVLVSVSAADQDTVRRMLSDDLSDYAASVQTTASVLAGYLQVQNTYLSTFQLLGALGLMLGTIGLAVVLIRTVIEREAELALLASLGFSTKARLRLVLTENTFLLASGFLLGTICALVGVLPALRDSARQINYTSLALTLAATLLTGLCASGVAVLIGSRRVTLAGLRKE